MSGRSPLLMPIIVAAMAATITALMGTTMTVIGPWYRSLKQPDWAPPEVAFGIVWTIIFTLTAISGVTAWRALPGGKSADTMIGLFAFNGFLNILWSFLFFRLQRPDWAVIEVAFLWLSIATLIFVLRRDSTTAALLLAPYLVWVTIAAALNYEVVRLNGPFA
ncbi:MAG: TspO/MBR family protein [Sphingomonadaceae bacterium]